ncbi:MULTISPECIES: CGNR zinc finger domain-containing protein [Kocuria]|uniref:CGNR zinc finger domain-containing protein n=1 Tax=Kocuria carniphila TaxID=262208 RepID=A0ABV3V2K7_9MICC|nr:MULTISPECIES: CGNR zinc finger domain-containing protein [Kocuria]
MNTTTPPLPLQLIEEFINTRRADGDGLATHEELEQWLTSRDLAPSSISANDSELSRARAVREGLRAVIAENNAAPVASPRPDGLNPSARNEFAKLAENLPLVVDVRSSPPRLVPQAGLSDVDSALAALLVGALTAVPDGTWVRLKACREPSCRRAFYDHSRNRSRSWCSMELCGNRAKGRAFYSRNQ